MLAPSAAKPKVVIGIVKGNYGATSDPGLEACCTYVEVGATLRALQTELKTRLALQDHRVRLPRALQFAEALFAMLTSDSWLLAGDGPVPVLVPVLQMYLCDGHGTLAHVFGGKASVWQQLRGLVSRLGDKFCLGDEDSEEDSEVCEEDNRDPIDDAMWDVGSALFELPDQPFVKTHGVDMKGVGVQDVRVAAVFLACMQEV